MKKKKYIVLLALVVIFVPLYFILHKSPKPVEVAYVHNEGKAQGTYYSATYQQPEGKDLQPEIEQFFSDFDASLSTYRPNSIISKINQNNDSVVTDAYFENMFKAAQEVSEKSNGAFDITVGPLVNAWGFGFETNDKSKLPDVAKLLPLIGYQKVKLVNHKIIKENPNIIIDASGIAQGYSADLIAAIFEKNGCKNYMIDIGGEIMCKGLNPKGKKWQIGVDKPVDDPEDASGELQTVLSISDIAVTTSGNYRKFYYKDGKKYAHTINPKTGYPVSHNLLSATVIAPTCIMADAYATAFMVVGVDSAMALCKRIPGMDCYLIYTDELGKYQVTYTDGFKKYLAQ